MREKKRVWVRNKNIFVQHSMLQVFQFSKKWITQRATIQIKTATIATTKTHN